jgi:hypothetical protein
MSPNIAAIIVMKMCLKSRRKRRHAYRQFFDATQLIPSCRYNGWIRKLAKQVVLLRY